MCEYDIVFKDGATLDWSFLMEGVDLTGAVIVMEFIRNGDVIFSTNDVIIANQTTNLGEFKINNLQAVDYADLVNDVYDFRIIITLNGIIKKSDSIKVKKCD